MGARRLEVPILAVRIGVASEGAGRSDMRCKMTWTGWPLCLALVAACNGAASPDSDASEAGSLSADGSTSDADSSVVVDDAVDVADQSDAMDSAGPMKDADELKDAGVLEDTDPIDQADAADLPDLADVGPTIACQQPATPTPTDPEPITYAKATPSTAGQVLCGPAAAPYFWAKAGIPAPVACTVICAPAAHADTTVCAGGQCLVARCSPGWQDGDGWGANGCEAAVPVACDLYADASAVGSLVQDGTMLHPFAAIASALCVAKAGCVIHVAAGSYAGGFAIDKPGVVLRGQGPQDTRIRGVSKADMPYKGVPTITIKANDVVLEGLAVVHGFRVGVAGLPGAHRPLLRQVVVTGTEPFSPTKYDGNESPCAIHLPANGARIVASTVHDIGALNSDGFVDQVTAVSVGEDARVLGVRVDGVQGIEPGGWAVGISAGKGSLATGCEVVNLHPAPGQPDPYNSYVSQAVNKYWPDGRALAFKGIRTDPTDGFDGQPWLDLVDCDGGKVQGIALTGPWHQIRVTGGTGVVIADNQRTGGFVGANPAISMAGCSGCKVQGNVVTDAHVVGIAISGSPGVVVKDNQVSNVQTVAPGNSGTILFGEPGHATGIRIEASGACSVTGNTVSSVLAGIGPTDVSVGQGGQGLGIRISDGAGCTVTDNVVSDVYGGKGAQDSYGPSGRTVGILVSGTGPVALVGNRVVGVTGGGGFSGWKGAIQVAGGPAMGIRCDAGACSSLIGNVVAKVAPGPTFDNTNGEPPLTPGKSTCVDLEATGPVAVDHLTCLSARFGLHATGKGKVAVSNSILADMEVCGFYGETPVDVTWTDLWNTASCGGGMTAGVGILKVDPQFVDAGKGDVHVLCSTASCSATIDAGDPAAAYCAEPAPNGCRVDLGAYGGTAQSTAKVGAKQCACP